MVTKSEHNKIAFVLDHDLKEYRIPFFNHLAKCGYKLSVFHTGNYSSDRIDFDICKVSSVKVMGFEYRKLPNFNGYDTVVHMQNIRILNLWFLTMNPFRRFKIIHWGIGVSSGNGLKKQNKAIIFLRQILCFFSDATILYSSYPISYYNSRLNEKLFVANNTVHSPLSQNSSVFNKEYFIFIGSLNSRKGLLDLIDAYNNYTLNVDKTNLLKLMIVGDGPLMSTLVAKVSELDLENYVIFKGMISDDVEKKSLFEKAVMSISPQQAGLSVLESFSYGVPCLVYENAISGGEHLNVKNYETGFRVKNKKQLYYIMLKMSSSRALSVYMGNRAYNFYHSNRSISGMAQPFISLFNGEC
ncbi:hypothetical protein BIY22_13045 [Vibrio panuliri]|uniref:Glycosyl transferase family 1 domain-containing protein n=1 Tax=Vibrio panuliri TaxID=1381081 RepID=A0A1Q9HAK4_9VIBR|nr:glycosyltransferase [Vibrio panuliri]OLQ86170.1 hypothetical protein BIY22_13045 [Vibrio panuliri]